jgi:hypothetical protein
MQERSLPERRKTMIGKNQKKAGKDAGEIITRKKKNDDRKKPKESGGKIEKDIVNFVQVKLFDPLRKWRASMSASLFKKVA